jgi:chromosomal replication initiator protein
VQTPKFEARELRQMRAELQTTAPEKVALRHGLDVAIVEGFQAKDEERQRERKEQAIEQAPAVNSIAEIQELVASHFGMTRGELKAVTRERKIVRPRQIAMYLALRVTHGTLGTIGQAFGGMHHTTVYHSIQVIDEGIKTDNGLRNTVQTLQRRIDAGAL